MAVRTVLRMGDPRLLEVARPVPESRLGSRWLRELVADLWDTLAACEGAGLAAPQIGAPWRVVVFRVADNRRYPQAEPVPATVLVNPRLTPLPEAGWAGAWEGCLSLPGLRGWVERPAAVRYRGLDETGAVVAREVSGFHARVVQHECDHLDGVLYPQRMRDMRRFGFVEALQAAGRLPEFRRRPLPPE